MIESTVKVTFAANYTPGYDQLYTYKTKDALEEGQLCWVISNEELKRVRVIKVDKEYDLAAEKRFGSLEEVYQRRPE